MKQIMQMNITWVKFPTGRGKTGPPFTNVPRSWTAVYRETTSVKSERSGARTRPRRLHCKGSRPKNVFQSIASQVFLGTETIKKTLRKHQDEKLRSDWCSVYNNLALIGPSNDMANIVIWFASHRGNWPLRQVLKEVIHPLKFFSHLTGLYGMVQ